MADVEHLTPGDAAAAELGGDRGADVGHGVADRAFEQLAVKARGWRLDLGGPVGGRGAVQARQHVQMHQPAALILGDLHVRPGRCARGSRQVQQVE